MTRAAQLMEAAVAAAWCDLCDKDDRTSPAEYPDMCLISRDELGAAISQGFWDVLQAGSDAPLAWLKEWYSDGEVRRRVDLTPGMDRWLEVLDVRVTPLFMFVEGPKADVGALVTKLWGQFYDSTPAGDPKDTLREIRTALAGGLESRVVALERDSHPPIDLSPAIDEILAERGYAPTEAPSISDADLERMCRAHDREDSAQRGEPSLWDMQADEFVGDWAEWREERLAAMRSAVEALAKPLPAGPAPWKLDRAAVARAIYEGVCPSASKMISFEMLLQDPVTAAFIWQAADTVLALSPVQSG